MTSSNDAPKGKNEPGGKNAKPGSSEQPHAQDSAPDEGAGKDAAASRGTNASDTFASAIGGLSKLYAATGEDGISPQVTDAVTQALLLVLGSAPSVVTIEGLLSAQNSSGLMYHNAVSNQQKTNLLGMAMTAKCVRYMLDPYPDDEIDGSTDSGNAGPM